MRHPAPIMPARPGGAQDAPAPWSLVQACESRFGRIVFDLAADAQNRKAPAFFSREEDSLAHDWTALGGGALWCNPPYANVAPWVRKASEWAPRRKYPRDLILLLAPASVGSEWFARYVYEHAWVLALRGRVRFEGQVGPFPRDLMIAVYGGMHGPGFEPWDWRPRTQTVNRRSEERT